MQLPLCEGEGADLMQLPLCEGEGADLMQRPLCEERGRISCSALCSTRERGRISQISLSPAGGEGWGEGVTAPDASR